MISDPLLHHSDHVDEVLGDELDGDGEEYYAEELPQDIYPISSKQAVKDGYIAEDEIDDHHVEDDTYG